MPSAIETVRTLHAPHLVDLDGGYDVQAICLSCTDDRVKALESADVELPEHTLISVTRVEWPCATAQAASTNADKDLERVRTMRLDELTGRAERLAEQLDRVRAVVEIIEAQAPKDDEPETDADATAEPVEDKAEAEPEDKPKKRAPRKAKKDEPADEAPAEPEADTDPVEPEPSDEDAPEPDAPESVPAEDERDPFGF